MLDAAHREGVGSCIIIQRTHKAHAEIHATRTDIAGSVGRRRPGIAVRADNIQGSRLTVAVARSNLNVISNRWVECRGEIFRTAAGWDVYPAKTGQGQRRSNRKCLPYFPLKAPLLAGGLRNLQASLAGAVASRHSGPRGAFYPKVREG